MKDRYCTNHIAQGSTNFSITTNNDAFLCRSTSVSQHHSPWSQIPCFCFYSESPARLCTVTSCVFLKHPTGLVSTFFLLLLSSPLQAEQLVLAPLLANLNRTKSPVHLQPTNTILDMWLHIFVSKIL